MQGLDGLMDRHERRTAGGVDRDRRTFETQCEGDAAGDRVEGVTGDEVRLDLVDRLRRQQVCVLIGTDARKDSGSAAAQRSWRVSGSLQTLPYGFEHQPLLWLDPDGLTRGDTEELGIESIDAVQESAETRVRLARDLRVGIVELVDIEAVFGHFPDRIHAAGQHIPEGLRIGSTGEAARDRDNRDRFVGAIRDGRSQLRRRLGLLVQTEHITEQVIGDIGDAGMIHHQGDRNLLTHTLFHAAPQFDRHQGIHAEVEESSVLTDFRDVNARHLGHRVAQVIGEQLLALLHGSVRKPLDELRAARLSTGRRPRQV
ncbi:Uncharacterised protein [Mycobacteroides abscessus subsp. massiliense]|nr:Uncharacterised protein [Mycobacteroides abscessus subsp. massiliense]